MFIGVVRRSAACFARLPVERYLLPLPSRRDSVLSKLRFVPAGRRVFMDPVRKIHPFAVLALCRGDCPRHLRAFGFEPADQTAKLLLGIVHIWILHRRMHSAGLETEKMLLWDYLWSHMRTILCAQGIHELQFRANLEEMQHKTLGFCLALDESMDEIAQKGDDTTLRKMLIIYFYQRNSGMMQSQPLDLLTKYILALVDFVSEVPEEEFRYAAFTW
ncbi:hypothetical protein, conserved [Babesia bigemina]|uniref:Ubiquinol-cytochrome c chaperone domain-containing protein n=1 Tax=Babesia bigemina TaxID=5866 RepID=A0A061DEI3_BABBI|nr:hypothetical protein, conserved [Babesia bigemina]CDR97330.1 hypothetical protein, conserved [Babesia bigemina]|eukprot:XP_012769516.1 hypothetical protein, conserved [Babesia bigemina]